jgi:prepilin peptidase CpaA
MYAGAALLCAVACAVPDVRERRIPNRITLSSIVFGLGLHLVVGGWHGLLGSAAAGSVAGGIFALLYIAGGMGAGDVKLMAAIGCLQGLPALGMVILATALAGGLFAVGLSLVRGRLTETISNATMLLAHHGRAGLRPHGELNLASPSAVSLPFAIPVVAGCLWTLCDIGWRFSQ